MLKSFMLLTSLFLFVACSTPCITSNYCMVYKKVRLPERAKLEQIVELVPEIIPTLRDINDNKTTDEALCGVR